MVAPPFPRRSGFSPICSVQRAKARISIEGRDVRALLGLSLGAALSVLCACGAKAAETRVDRAPARNEPAVFFSYRTTQGQELSHGTTRGRSTALVFLTTYDAASQLEAKELEQALRTTRPRANGAAVILEGPEYGLLADVFRQSLGLSYPVALADEATLEGRGPFGKIELVPTTVVLDRWGRLRFRRQGLSSSRELSQMLKAASAE